MKKWIIVYVIIIFAALGLDLCVPWRHSSVADVLACWLGGCLFFGVGWFSYFSEYEFFRRAIVVPGTIDGYYGTRKSPGYSVVVSFNLDGNMQTVRARMLSLMEPVVGSTCEVGLDPTNISTVRIRSEQWFFCFICFVFAFPGFLMLINPVLPR